MPDRDQDVLFGEAAVAGGFISAEQLDAYLGELAAERARGARITLSDLLAIHEVLTPLDVQRVRRSLEQPAPGSGGPAPLDVPPAAPGDGTGVRRAGRATPFEGKYAVRGEIGRGGMGIVLNARDLDIRREVAIKVLGSAREADPDLIARFVGEAQIQGQLEHPNICPVHDVGVDAQGRMYFTMKKVKGHALGDILRAMDDGTARPPSTASRRGKRPDPAAADPAPEGSAPPFLSLHPLLEVFTKVCDAVAFAHSRGVIHRDLKPDNIMIGEFGEVLVMDWGLAKIVGRQEKASGFRVISDRVEQGVGLSMAGDIIGTPAYMAPEQARGRLDLVDERSDVYALGGILYAMLTWRPPVPGADVTTILGVVERGEIPSPSRAAPQRHVPPDLDAAAQKAMAPRQEDRYPSVKALKADITAFLEGRTLSAADYNLFQLTSKWVHRNQAFALTAGAAAAIFLVGAEFYVINVNHARDATLQAAGVAQAEAGRARAAETDARRRLADGLVAEGNALGLGGRWREARARLLEAWEAGRQVDASTLAVDLGLWEAHRRSPVPLLTFARHARPVFAAAFAPDGRRAVSGDAAGVVKVWDAATGRESASVAAHNDAVLCAAFSPDGRLLLTGGKDGALTLRAAASGREVRALAGHVGWVMAAAFSPDGRRALSGGQDATVRLWDVETGRELRAFAGHSAPVSGVAFSPDGARALSGGQDATVRLWNVETGRELRAFAGFSAPVAAVAFSPDGRRILSGGGDKSLILWDAESGRAIRTFAGHGGWVMSVAFSPDGLRAVSGGADDAVRVWDVETGREIRLHSEHDDTVMAVAFSPDGCRLLSGSQDGSVRVWGAGEGREVVRFSGHGAAVEDVAVSPDGLLAVSGGGDREVRLWDLATGLTLRVLSGHTDSVTGVAFAPDGRRVCSSSGDHSLRQWDIVTGRETGLMRGHGDAVMSVAYSPDGLQLLSGGWDRTVRLWEAGSGRELRVFRGHAEPVTRVAFAPDGRLILSGSWDGTLREWDPATGNELRSIGGHGSAVLAAACSPDGRIVASGGEDKTVRLWNADTGWDIRTHTGHAAAVMDVVFSPDGRLLASAGQDNSIRLWEVSTGREMRSFEGHAAPVSAVAFTPDGRAVLSAGEDRQVRLWDLARPARYRELGSRAEKASAALQDRPADAASLAALGEWYAFRGEWDWAAEFLEKARAGGAKVPALLLGRCRWQRAAEDASRPHPAGPPSAVPASDDLAAARREFERARAQGEAPDYYIALCLEALGR